MESDMCQSFSFLPGRLLLEPGTSRDYRQLERFHYVPGRPATIVDVVRIVHELPQRTTLAAVGVLSYPVPCCTGRRIFFSHGPPMRYREHLRFANNHLRTISRVIVHPQYRSLGLAVWLVRHLIDTCPTPWVEAIARMGRVHPFFEHAGMIRVPVPTDSPAYFIALTPAGRATHHRPAGLA
jgi:GNAT superfamily N-acetyltransferase